MKYFLSIFFLSFCLSCLSAQEKRFVFIQSDNNQPFYVFLNEKLYSSTAKGYIIIPKLNDGDYNFSIGFAQNAFPEQNFKYTIQKDVGFNLKNFGEKGWGLFNLQSLSVTMASDSNTDNVAKAISKSGVAKEKDEPLISFNKKKKDTVAANIKTNADALSDERTVKDEKLKDQEVNPDNAISEAIVKNGDNAEKPGTTSNVKKVSEFEEADGKHLAFAEDDGKKTDTIQIIIPSDKTVSNTENNSSSSQPDISNSTEASSAALDNNKAKNDSLKFLNINPDKSKTEEKGMGADLPNNTTALTNSKCKNVATDEDYSRLRRKMARETSDEKMINEAKKIYRNKCFTTSQIKKLSTLFLSDEGRYNFFNASYNSVADTSQYYQLQSEFIDPAFVNRFKNLLQ